jgi:pentapeptide MXKDX repeat protein
MRNIWKILVAAGVSLVVGLVLVGCGATTSSSKDKMDGGKMDAGKMDGDKMKGDKMDDGKMKGDKMEGDKKDKT